MFEIIKRKIEPPLSVKSVAENLLTISMLLKIKNGVSGINFTIRSLSKTPYKSPKSATNSTGGVITKPTFIYSPQPIFTPFCAKT